MNLSNFVALSGTEAKDRQSLESKRDGHMTQLAWLRQLPIKPNSQHMLEHIELTKHPARELVRRFAQETSLAA
jgi:hypothetical protein